MKHRPLIGSKIRRSRKRAALTQAEMAARLGISPSYLNLIEHNRRALTPSLGQKIGTVLGLDPNALSGGEEGRLLASLAEVFSDPLFKDGAVGPDDLRRLVGAAPGAAGSLCVLYRAYLEANQDTESQAAHLAGNPFLEASSHRLLTLLTSIRSFSEILRDNADLAAERRQQYIGTVVSESEKLTDLVNELFAFISGGGLGKQRELEAPGPLVAEYMEASGNYFAELEDAARGLRPAPAVIGVDLAPLLAARLHRDHGISVEITPWNPGDTEAGAPPVHFDEAASCLRLSEVLPASSRRFEIAHRLALAAAGPLLDRMAARAGLGSPAATALLRRCQSQYLAAAILMPYSAFLEAARGLRHDLEVLPRRFGASFEQVCQRLATLQRPGAEGIPFHFMRADLAGNITLWRGVSGLRIPRFTGACPRWNLHRAFMTPGRIDIQLARFPGGSEFIFLARSQTGSGTGRGLRERPASTAIACDISFAHAVVYADGLGLPGGGAFTPVGVHCRQCAWPGCGDRVFPSALP